MTNKISYSKMGCFNECPKKYYYRYIEKYTSELLASPLFFGSAIDESLNYVLSAKKNNEQVDEEKVWEMFDQEMTKYNPTQIDYFNSDVTFYLLNDDDIKKFEEVDSNFPEICRSTQLAQNAFIKEFKQREPEAFCFLAWISLYRKGTLIIETFISDVLPLFNSITGVQEELTVDNGDDDELKCIIDFVANIKLIDLIGNDRFYIPENLLNELDINKVYNIVMDNKTSSKAYTKTSVKESEQLSLYSEFYETNLCGYVVFNKKILKGGKLNWQIIIDKIDEDFKERTFEKLEDSLYHMKVTLETGEFHKNTDACFSYGRRCDYYELCKNGNTQGLKKRSRK